MMHYDRVVPLISVIRNASRPFSEHEIWKANQNDAVHKSAKPYMIEVVVFFTLPFRTLLAVYLLIHT